MPFSHFHYRWVKSSDYSYQKRRCCFIAACLIYSLIFAGASLVFLGLYINIIEELNSLSCSSCAYLGATTNCGYHTCCNYSLQTIYNYGECAGIYGEGLYFILFIVFLVYSVYEILLMICMLCNGSALQYNQEVIIIEQNQQLVNMTAYQQQGDQINQPNQYYTNNY